MVVAYNFDLRFNKLTTELVPNPNAGKEHVFKAYRLDGDPLTPVRLVERSRGKAELAYQDLFGGDDDGGDDDDGWALGWGEVGFSCALLWRHALDLRPCASTALPRALDMRKPRVSAGRKYMI